MENKNSTGVGGGYVNPQVILPRGFGEFKGTASYEVEEGKRIWQKKTISDEDFKFAVLFYLEQQLSLNKRNTMYTGIGAAVAVCAFVAWLFWG